LTFTDVTKLLENVNIDMRHKYTGLLTSSLSSE
jgi:hypothetical protein